MCNRFLGNMRVLGRPCVSSQRPANIAPQNATRVTQPLVERQRIGMRIRPERGLSTRQPITTLWEKRHRVCAVTDSDTTILSLIC